MHTHSPPNEDPALTGIDYKISCYYYIKLYTWGRGSEKGPIAYIISSFQIISYSKRHLYPLQILFYALEISLSRMELQGSDFLITRTLLLHPWT